MSILLIFFSLVACVVIGCGGMFLGRGRGFGVYHQSGRGGRGKQGMPKDKAAFAHSEEGDGAKKRRISRPRRLSFDDQIAVLRHAFWSDIWPALREFSFFRCRRRQALVVFYFCRGVYDGLG